MGVHGARRGSDPLRGHALLNEKERIKGGRGVVAAAGATVPRPVRRQWKAGEGYIAKASEIPIAQLRLFYRDSLWYEVHSRRQEQATNDSFRRKRPRHVETRTKQEAAVKSEDEMRDARKQRHAAQDTTAVIDLT